MSVQTFYLILIEETLLNVYRLSLMEEYLDLVQLYAASYYPALFLVLSLYMCMTACLGSGNFLSLHLFVYLHTLLV